MASVFDKQPTEITAPEKKQEQVVLRLDNNKKALDRLQTKDFIDTARDWYAFKEQNDDILNSEIYSNSDILEVFYEDRSWGNYNTISMSKDYALVSEDLHQDRLKQFAYIQQTYNQLPSWWDDPNRDFGDWLADSGVALIADPLNLVGGVVGKQAAKTAFQQALKQELKGKAAKAVSQKMINEAAKNATGKAIGKATLKSGMYEGLAAGTVSLIQDGYMQNINITTGIQDEFNYKQSAIATAAGLGFGTAFGGLMGNASFRLTRNSLKSTAVKNLKELHDFGFDELTGKALFRNLTVDELKLKGKSKEELERIKKDEQLTGKSLVEQARERADTKVVLGEKGESALNFSTRGFSRAPEKMVEWLKKRTEEIQDEKLDTSTIPNHEIERVARETYGEDPQALISLLKKQAKTPLEEQLSVQVFALDELMLKLTDDFLVNAGELGSITAKKDVDDLIKVLDDQLLSIDGALQLRKQVVKQIGQGLQALQIPRKTATKATTLDIAELLVDPKELAVLNKTGNKSDFYRKLGQLDDVEQIAEVLGRSRKADSWDVLNEYINNNLLSSPDTHILNITSSIWHMHWKPLVRLLRAANIARQGDYNLAKNNAQEAFSTYLFTFVYMVDGLRAMGKAFHRGKPVLDGMSQKLDASQRQGVLQGWIKGFGDAWLNGIPVIGRPVNKLVVRPLAYTVSAPLRVLSAGDEFLKTASFKARAASQVTTVLNREHPDLPFLSLDYRKKYKEYMDNYIDSNGEAITASETRHADKLTAGEKSLANDPLHYAREITYTNPASSVNPVTGETEAGITGAVLNFAAKNKWSRALGLHFINTPSNLLRFFLQHMPSANLKILQTGKYHFQMKHMLAKGKDGRYLNPEAAAEAQARIQAGYMLLIAGFYAAHNGTITGGGNPKYFIRQQEEATTGKQPYSFYDKDTGRYIALDRGDPMMGHFFIMADLYEAFEEYFRPNPDADIPNEKIDEFTQLMHSSLISLTRNLTSKFYSRDIFETVNIIIGSEHLQWRNPDRKGAAFVGRMANKVVPLSGLQRYYTRVTDEVQRDVITIQDRIAFLKDRKDIMPRRNIFGEVMDRKTGWFFGVGSEDKGIWSSPFALTSVKDDAVLKFFETTGRDFKYAPPKAVDSKSGLDLKKLRNTEGQTAYDRWMEIKNELVIGKETIQQRFIREIKDPKSVMNKVYSARADILGTIDPRQEYLLEWVRTYETIAYEKMVKEFPAVREAGILRSKYSALESLLGKEVYTNKLRQEGRDLLNRMENYYKD